jgi:hypothetical protein
MMLVASMHLQTPGLENPEGLPEISIRSPVTDTSDRVLWQIARPSHLRLLQNDSPCLGINKSLKRTDVVHREIETVKQLLTNNQNQIVT